MNLCRPLLKPSCENQKKFIDLPYCFTIAEIQQLRLYLPSTVVFFGIDASKNYVVSQEDRLKYRNKIVAVQGFDQKKNISIEFIPRVQYTWRNWDVNVILMFPEINPRRSSSHHDDSLKKQIRNSLFIEISDGQSIIQDQLYSAKTISQAAIKIQLPKISGFKFDNMQKYGHNSKQKKGFIGKMKVGLLLSNNKKYKGIQIIEILCEDINSSITIMEAHDVCYRQLQLLFDILPFQNFLKTDNKQQDAFSRFLKRMRQKQIIEPKPKDTSVVTSKVQKVQEISKATKTDSPKIQQNHNQTIIATGIGLILLIMVYLYVRFRFLAEDQSNSL